MGHGENTLWALIVDMSPLLIMLAIVGIVGCIILRTASAELKQWRGGKFYRPFLALMLIELIFMTVILFWRKTHP